MRAASNGLTWSASAAFSVTLKFDEFSLAFMVRLSGRRRWERRSGHFNAREASGSTG